MVSYFEFAKNIFAEANFSIKAPYFDYFSQKHIFLY